MAKKIKKLVLDWGDKNADWLKLLPQAKEDQAAGEQVTKELRAKAGRRGRANKRSK